MGALALLGFHNLPLCRADQDLHCQCILCTAETRRERKSKAAICVRTCGCTVGLTVRELLRVHFHYVMDFAGSKILTCGNCTDYSSRIVSFSFLFSMEISHRGEPSESS